jgi:hypothetical protein
MASTSGLIEVFAGTAIDAAVVRSALEADGLHVVVTNEEMGTLAPFQVAPGGVAAVRLLVAEEDAARAREIIEQA